MTGLWVVGPSRSGTSMIAGLFAAHGVFFGRTRDGDEYNPKGYFEHGWLKSLREIPKPDDWPDPWFDRLRSEGWDRERPWGVKSGPRLERLVRPMAPTVVVVCRRPMGQILASRRRVRWAVGRARVITNRVYEAVEKMTWANRVDVRTDRVADGYYKTLAPAFDALGIDFDLAVASNWIDRSVWNRAERGQ